MSPFWAAFSPRLVRLVLWRLRYGVPPPASAGVLPRRRLRNRLTRSTLSYMKTATLTIRMDDDLSALLDRASKRTGRNRSDIAREALRRQLRVTRFENLRKRVMPFAEARGYLTDDDVFADAS